MKKSWPYLVIVIALFLGINAPSLFSEGMFMDGLIYATVSRNLAFGEGTFWFLHFSDTHFQSFHEHPPLAIGLQSLFFKVFGDSFYVERFYSLFTYFISLFLIKKIWFYLVDKNKNHSKLYWLPMLLFSIIGVVGWAYSNNMLENTMTIFVLASYYLLLKSLVEFNKKIKYSLLLFAGLTLFLGFLTKGFVALFPLVTIGVYGVFSKKINFFQSVFQTAIVLFGILLSFVFLYFVDNTAIESLGIYFNKQVANSIKNVATVSSRFWILKSFIQQMIPIFILGIFIAFFAKSKIKYRNIYKEHTIATFIVGLSGILPIIISLKQRDFYIISAYPFIVFSCSLLLIPFISVLIQKIESNKGIFKWLERVGVILLSISIIITVFQFGRIGRDKEVIQDIRKITATIPENSVIRVTESLIDDWAVRAYLERYHHVNLTMDNNADICCLLSDTPINIDGFEDVSDDLLLEKFSFYNRKINKTVSQ